MAIKYAQEIAQEIYERGAIVIPPNAVTGDAFESWLYEVGNFKGQVPEIEEEDLS